MIPILLTVTFLDHQQVRWGYLVGAVACIIASIGFQIVYAAVTRGAASVEAQANSWFIIACLALAGLACIEAKHLLGGVLVTELWVAGETRKSGPSHR